MTHYCNAILVDQLGNVVSHPDASSWTKPLKDYVVPEVFQTVKNVIQDGMLRHTRSLSRVTGEEALMVVCALPIADTGRNWAMLLVAPASEVMAPVRYGMMLIALTGGLVIVISLLVLYFTVSRMIAGASADGGGKARKALPYDRTPPPSGGRGQRPRQRALPVIELSPADLD